MMTSIKQVCNYSECKNVYIKCKTCSACRRVYYCSRECQKTDWKTHKSKCKKVTRRETERNVSDDVERPRRRGVGVFGRENLEKKKREEFDPTDIETFLNACKEGNTVQVQDFLKRGIDVNARNKYQETSLHLAADKGHVDVAKVLIRNGADVHAVEGYKMTPLSRTGWNGHVEVAKVLIQNGADVNAVDRNKWTPLHCAAQDGFVDVANVFIQNGADVNAVDRKYMTPLHYVFKNTGIVQKYVDLAKVLIQNSADVNAVDRDNETPLHFAAQHGHAEIAKVLIQNGADVNAVNKYDGTPLHDPAHYGNAVLTLRLLCFGATIDKKALEVDKTGLLGEIDDRMRDGSKGIETTLMSIEERKWMRNLAFSLTIQCRSAAFNAYYTIRSFITFHGIFMGDGYDRGDDSVWKT